MSRAKNLQCTTIIILIMAANNRMLADVIRIQIDSPRAKVSMFSPHLSYNRERETEYMIQKLVRSPHSPHPSLSLSLCPFVLFIYVCFKFTYLYIEWTCRPYMKPLEVFEYTILDTARHTHTYVHITHAHESHELHTYA